MAAFVRLVFQKSPENEHWDTD